MKNRLLRQIEERSKAASRRAQHSTPSPQRRNRLNQTTDWRFTDFFDDSDGLLNNSLAWGSTLRHLYWKVFTSSRFQRHRFAIAIVTGHSFIFGSSNLEVENPVLAY